MSRRSRSPQADSGHRYKRQRSDPYDRGNFSNHEDYPGRSQVPVSRSRHDREREFRREEGRHGYREADRERERQRDRERYDRDTRSGDPSASSRRPIQDRGRSVSRSASPPVNKAQPNFGASGLLAAETNTVKSLDGKNSTVLKYNEPPEARKPSQGWRLYVFKGEEQTEMLLIHRQSAYLFGRDRLVADIPVEHPSCSKQHAVIQYRLIREKDEFGSVKGIVKPFIIDLESTNGTHVNDEAIPPSRYYELKAADVIKFGLSAREYVLLHDHAA